MSHRLWAWLVVMAEMAGGVNELTLSGQAGGQGDPTKL